MSSKAKFSFDAKMFDEDSDAEDYETFSQYTVRRDQKRKKKLANQLLKEKDPEITTPPIKLPYQVAIPLKVVQFIVNVLAFFFLLTAGIGAVIHIYDIFLGNESVLPPVDIPGQTPGSDSEEVDWETAKQTAILAFQTTMQALKLWSKLVYGIIIPTSHKTFMITREGFVAMQPSLLISVAYVSNLPPAIKTAIGATLAGISLAMYGLHEAKKRKVVEKIYDGYYYVGDYVAYSYERFLSRISKQSRIVGYALPHFLFIAGSVAFMILGPDLVRAISLGVGGWAIVIGMPIALSTRALVLYDHAYNDRIIKLMAKNRKQSKRRMSHLPNELELQAREARAKSFMGMATNFFSLVRKPFVSDVTKLDPVDEEFESNNEEEEFRPYINKKNYKTMRGVRPVEYPKFMDTDDESSAEQFQELSEVIWWLKYWLILSSALVLEQLPVVGHFLSVLPVWPIVRLFYSVWLQLPLTRGCELAFNFAVPIISKYWQRIEIAPTARTTNFLANILINQLPISPENKTYLAEIGETDSTLLVAAFGLMFMPQFVVAIGCVFIGIGKPMYSGIVSVLSVETAAYSAKARLAQKTEAPDEALTKLQSRAHRVVRRMAQGNENDLSVTVASASLHCTAWLEYWCVYSVIMLGVGAFSSIINFIPFWYQIQLGCILWLQLPYFRGARRTFKLLLQLYYTVRKRYFGKEEENEGEEEIKQTEVKPKKLNGNGKTTKRKKRINVNKDTDEVNVVRKLDDDVGFREIEEEAEPGTTSGLEKALQDEETSVPPSPTRSINLTDEESD